MDILELVNNPGADHFVVEGRWCVEALLANPTFETVGIVKRVGTHSEFSAPESIPLIELPAESISDAMGFKFHRGLIAVAKRPTALIAPTGALLVACIELADASNLGSIIRSAAALGAGGILLEGKGTDVFSRKAIRASSGAVFRLPIHSFPSLQDAVQSLREHDDYEVLGSAIHSERARPMTEFSQLDENKRIVLFGSEADGLAEGWLKLCDSIFEIPMSNDVDSLNVAASAAIALYQLGPNRA